MSKIIIPFLILLTLFIYSCSTKYCGVGDTGTVGCPSYNPVENPGNYPNIILRTQKQEKKGIEVSTAVLTDREIKEVFGLELAKQGIQPVWINIKNNSKKAYYLVKVHTDPLYFSPNEVATMNYINFAIDVNKAIDSYINDKSISRQIPTGSEVSGFYYANWDPGAKYLSIALYSEKDVQSFIFVHEIPGLKVDYKRVDFENLYTEDEWTEIETCEELLNALEQMPCCTQKKDGSGENDPLNFIIIGEPENIFGTFLKQGWDVTETINVSSGWRAAKSFFTNERWRTSPMSALYFYNRPQDIGLQKARSTIHERNHLRLWITPYIFKGQTVWMGAISRDIGSYFTWKTTWKTAHAIDPDIDEARNFLIQDLIYSQLLYEFGWLDNAMEPATSNDPHINFMEQPWWTDGRRGVLVLGPKEHSIYDIKNFSCIDETKTVK